MCGSALRHVVPLLLLLAMGSGCSRKFFRQRADDDVAGVITQKNHFPDWAVKNWWAYPHPDSRYADPYNPDRPPYPPDDYAARLLSPNPQHPTARSGTGRVDNNEGYMRILQEFDAENRAADGGAARGAPPDRIYLPPPPFMGKGNTGSVKTALTPTAASPQAPPTSASADAWNASGSPNPPSAPIVGPPATVAQAHATPPAPVAPTTPPVSTESSQWLTAKPRITVGNEATPPAVAGPNITETHGPEGVVAPTPPPQPPTVPAVAVALTPIPEPQPPTTVPAMAIAPVMPQPPAALPEPTTPVAVAREPAMLPLQPEKLPNVPLPTGQPGGGGIMPGTNTPIAQGFPSVAALTALGSTEADYLRALFSNQQGYRIKLNQAVELGLINSREFQDRREDLYLAALPVTLERFNLAAQAFATEQVVRNFTGSQLSGAGRLWQLNTTGGFNKTLATGGSLVVQLANQVVINLGQGRPDVAVSNLSLNFLQPFLRGGGFAVTLENLTAAERNLVYAMRSYARFRKLYYTATSAGPISSLGLTNNPYGLQGLSVNLGRGIGGNLTAPVVGYMPMLQQAAVINNQQRNVAFLERLLRQYQAYAEGSQLSELQVGQVEVQLLNSRASLLGTSGGNSTSGPGIRGFLDALDNYKLQLGLPITVGLDLDDAPLRPIREQLARFEDVYADLARLDSVAGKFDPADPIAGYRARWLRLFTTSELLKGTEFAAGITARWDSWAKLTGDQLTARLADLAKERNALLDRRAERRVKGIPEPQEEIQKLIQLDAELELGNFEREMRLFETQPWNKDKGPERLRAQAAAFRSLYNSFYLVALEGRNERLARVRQSWPKLPTLPIGSSDVLSTSLDEAYTAGIQAALTSRLDLMNARGLVVDAYRQIAVDANALQGVLNVGYNTTANTPLNGSQPFTFSGNRSTQQLTIQAELPLVRRAERNNYRATLISYQRQRRTLMAFEDNITNDVRGDIRELRTIAQLYRIQQRVVEIQYSQVESARETLFAPLAANQNLDPAQQASLTQQLLNAQNTLLSAQNSLFNYWVGYISGRMSFYLDLELMQLDDRGVWTDEQSPGTNDLPRPAPGPQPERLAAPQPAGGGAER